MKNKRTNKLIEKEIRFVVIRGGGCEVGELDEGGQKVQTSRYKVNKCWDVIYIMINIINYLVCYMKIVKRVNRKSSYYKEKYFSISLILYLYEMIDVH